MTKRELQVGRITFNPQIRDRVYGPQGKVIMLEDMPGVQALTDKAVQDTCSFFAYYDVVRGLVKNARKGDRKRAYEEMQALQKKYPRNNVLKNKLDDAKEYLI